MTKPTTPHSTHTARLRARPLVWVVAVLASLAVVGGLWWRATGDAVAVQPAGGGRWVTPVRQDVHAVIELTGTLAPADVAVVHAPFDGNLEHVRMTRGQTVATGEVLFSVSAPELQDRRNEAWAEASRARIALDELKHWQGGWQMAQARQAVERADAARVRAKKKREQVAVLVEKGIAAAAELSDADVEVESANDALANARTQLAQESRKAAPEELQLAVGRYEAAQASYQALSQRLAHARVLAPRPGIVVRPPGAKPWSDGMKVSQDDALLGVWDGRSYVVRTQIDQRDIPHIHTGRDAVVHIDALGVDIPAKVGTSAFDAGTDAAGQARGTAQYDTEIRLHPAGPLPTGLRPGMTAAVTLTRASIAQALTVPLAALRRTDGDTALPAGQARVWVKQQGRAVARTVTTGITTFDAVQIVSGLQASESVWVPIE